MQKEGWDKEKKGCFTIYFLQHVELCMALHALQAPFLVQAPGSRAFLAGHTLELAPTQLVGPAPLATVSGEEQGHGFGYLVGRLVWFGFRPHRHVPVIV
jgi:hypothetical protein